MTPSEQGKAYIISSFSSNSSSRKRRRRSRHLIGIQYWGINEWPRYQEELVAEPGSEHISLFLDKHFLHYTMSSV